MGRGMRLLSISNPSKSGSGILYILIIRLACGKEVYKVGVTQRAKIEDRVSEILTGFWVSYRYFPYCYPKRFKTTEDVYSKEAQMHRQLAEYKYVFEKEFGGHTEFFHEIELDELVQMYEDII